MSEKAKAPHRITINDGSENGTEPVAAAETPAAETASEDQPQPAAVQTEPSDPGPYVVELATVEAMLARHSQGQAKRELLVLAVAGAAFMLAFTAWRRANALAAELDAEGETAE